MFLRHNLYGILWALFILLVCGLPSGEFPVSPQLKHFDKAVHFYLYAQFAYLLTTGFTKQFQFANLRNRAIGNAFLISFFYGIFVETLQFFVFKERSFEVFDILANFFGIIFGILFFHFIYGKTSN